MITENFLHFVWLHQAFHKKNLTSVTGQRLKVVRQGFTHHDAGPDFKQAIIKIDDMVWAGDIEIHIKSSDWLRHRHQNDEKYNSVILHVVFYHDINIYYNENEEIITLALHDKIPKDMIKNYQNFTEKNSPIPCEKNLSLVNHSFLSNYLIRLVNERLKDRQLEFYEILKRYQYNWHELLFHVLVMNFGFKTNTVAFELLAKSLPYKRILECSHAKLQIYAIIFGQAGMLNEEIPEDKYYQNLQSEYFYLRKKYKLTSIHVKTWNLLRLRPSNFPCIRLAQLCEVMHHSSELFYTILNNGSLSQIESLFQNKPDRYWDTHYYFGKESKRHSSKLGRHGWQLIVINTIIPVLYAYGTYLDNPIFQEKAATFLEMLPFENNFVATKFKQIGFPHLSAVHSQGVLQLSKKYCMEERCLECAIGKKLIYTQEIEEKNNSVYKEETTS